MEIQNYWFMKIFLSRLLSDDEVIMKKILILFAVCLFAKPVFADTYGVISLAGNYERGTLLSALNDACDAPGDDIVEFVPLASDHEAIYIKDPLVIPFNCKGKVHIKGDPNNDVVINARDIGGRSIQAGDQCTLNIYSGGHTIEHLSFVNNPNGAGACVFGKGVTIKNSRFGSRKDGHSNPNRYGIVVTNAFAEEFDSADAGQVILNNNFVAHNTGHGIYIRANDTIIKKNTILANGGCPGETLVEGHPSGCEESNQDLGYGIFVDRGSQNVVIGGDSPDFANTIQYNRDGGVGIFGDDTFGVTVSKNIISRNYGTLLGIDLGADGQTLNDDGDFDEGVNNLLNNMDSMLALHMPQDDSFWFWGATQSGNKVELYLADEVDWARGVPWGGAAEYLYHMTVRDLVFNVKASPTQVHNGDIVTALVFDDQGNTSEFSLTIPVGYDQDWDGIPDDYEGFEGDDEVSQINEDDSDGDGLPDSVEDKNRNGIWEPDLGETSAYKKDSDSDGINDFFETKGDGDYKVGFDTDPLSSDTDNDGLLDGEEDRNGNGVIEIHLGETLPTKKDTDQDGVWDGRDNCPHIYNPYQDDIYCHRAVAAPAFINNVIVAAPEISLP